MHELSIAMNIVDLAAEEAERHGGGVVSAVHIKLGPLSGVVKETLLFAYDVACEQTSLAGSRLVIEDVPIVIFCENCNAERPAESMQAMICAECAAPATRLISGRELEISALEIEE